MASGGRLRAFGLHHSLRSLRQDAAREVANMIRAPLVRLMTAVPDHVPLQVTPPSAAGMGPFVANRLEGRTLPQRFHKRAEEVELPSKAERADHTLYSKRHKFPGYIAMLKLFQKGAIVEAMTRFYLATQQWRLIQQGEILAGEADFEITPHIIDDLLRTLSRLASTSDDLWNGFVQLTPRQSYWIPPNLASGVDVRRMILPRLCVYAICSIHDISGALGIVPSSASVAAVLHAFSKNFDESTFTKCMTMLLLRLSGASFDESVALALSSPGIPVERFDFKAFPTSLIKAIVEAFGRLGRPHVGEAMLQHWTKSHKHSEEKSICAHTYLQELDLAWKRAKDGVQGSVPAPVWVPSSGWAEDVKMWSALIRSRSFASDLAGARHWFNRYRKEGLALARSLPEQHLAAPHVEYILACTKIRKGEVDQKESEEPLEPDAWIDRGKPRYDAVVDVIKLMHRDGAPLTTSVFTLLLNFQIGYGRLSEATGMIADFMQSKEAKLAWPSGFYRSLFHLHRLLCTRESAAAAAQLSGLVVEDQRGKEHFVGNVRSLYKDYISQPGFHSARWTAKAKLDGLKEALHAGLASDDYPLVFMILYKFQQDCLPIDEWTKLCIIQHMFPSHLKSAREEERRSRHTLALQKTTKTLIQENTPEGHIHRMVFTSKYEGEDKDEQENAKRFVGWAKTKIVNRFRRVMRRNGPLQETDAQWLHDAIPAFKGRDFRGKDDRGKDLVKDKEILDVVLRPLRL